MEKIKSPHHHCSIFPNDASLIGSTNPAQPSEEKILLSKTIEKFVSEQVVPKLADLEVHDYKIARQLFGHAGDLGLLGADVPEAYGGFAMGKSISGLIAEKMGFGGSFSVSFNIHTGVGTLPYVYFGTEQQKETYLPKLSSGEWIGAYALTEPNAGSDALSASTTAKLDLNTTEWVVNGEKQWITNAHIANCFVVFAKTTEGMTAFIIERTMPGVSIGPEEKKLGIKGSSTATLLLEDVRIPKESVLGEVGKGHHIALNILNLARLKLSFANIGVSKQSLEIAVNYGKERQQFQKKIVCFPMIQEKLADMAVAIYGAESSAYYTANLLDSLDASVAEEADVVQNLSKFAVDCAINKVYASEALDFIVDEALQIHGGYGYMQDYEIERLYRDARINRIFEGTNEINRLTIAKSFLKQYYQDKSIIEEKEVSEVTGRNHRFVQLSIQLLQLSLRALPEMTKQALEQEQVYLRLLGDVVKDIYVMKAALLRLNKTQSNQPIQQLIVDIQCEEGYRKIEAAALSIISSIALDNSDKEALHEEIKALRVPLYANLVLKKRKIALEVINKNGYCV
ncbi:acyl-CoA dehydrogenase family protein [Virgibacillus sp. FSP13]